MSTGSNNVTLNQLTRSQEQQDQRFNRQLHLAAPSQHLTNAASISKSGSTLKILGGSTINEALTVTGAATCASTLAVTGASTLTGAATCASTLAVTGALTVTQASTFTAGALLGTLGVTGVSTFTGDVKAALPSFADYTAVNLTADTTLALATHSAQIGKYVTVSADAKTLTLPAVVVGATFIIVNAGLNATQLLTISPNANDKFLVDIAGAAGTDGKDIINTKATMKQYDYVKLVGISAEGWLIDEVRGTWVDES